jgi:hypothetical protein
MAFILGYTWLHWNEHGVPPRFQACYEFCFSVVAYHEDIVVDFGVCIAFHI